MRQRGRTLVHFVNLSGHADTAYHAPVPMREIEVRVKGNYESVRSAALERPLPATRAGDYTRFVLPSLEAYDAVTLE